MGALGPPPLFQNMFFSDLDFRILIQNAISKIPGHYAMEKYAGNEKQLYLALCVKYNLKSESFD